MLQNRLQQVMEPSIEGGPIKETDSIGLQRDHACINNASEELAREHRAVETVDFQSQTTKPHVHVLVSQVI